MSVIPNILTKTDVHCLEYVHLLSKEALGNLKGVESNDPDQLMINLYNEPGFNKENWVGVVKSGTKARLLRFQNSFYQIESPFDHHVGWISHDYVADIIMLDPSNLEECK